MNYAVFWGCKIPFYLPQYELSVRAILNVLGVKITNMEFNCCGYPIRHDSFEASVFSGARNIALALNNNVNILTPCKCCFGNLMHVNHWLRENKSLREKVNTLLKEEGLEWDSGTEIRHLLSVLFHDVGLEAVQAKIRHPYNGLKVAVHYGCHALRPGNVVQFDNPFAPTIFESLVAVTGAEPVDWPGRLECCGNPLWEKNRQLSLKLMKTKIDDALQSGAAVMCVACTYCQIQFDSVRMEALKDDPVCSTLPSVLYSQLLGLAFGIDEKQLGLKQNKTGQNFNFIQSVS